MTLTQMEQVELGRTIANVRDNDVPPLAAVCERGKPESARTTPEGSGSVSDAWVNPSVSSKIFICTIKYEI